MTDAEEERLYEQWTHMVHDAAHLEDMAREFSEVLREKSQRMLKAKDEFRTMLIKVKVLEEQLEEKQGE